MEIENFFRDKTIKIIFVIFSVLTVISIIYAAFTQRGLLYDGSIYFLNMLNRFAAGDWMYSISDIRSRGNIIVLWQIPVNIAYHIFGISSKYWLSVIFSFPLFAFPAIVTYLNYPLSKRSKRYDIAIMAFAIFIFFSIPTGFYSVVEVLLAAPMFFLLYHYSASDIDYNVFDICAIIFLLIISYNSSEIVVYSSIFLLFSALYHSRKEIKLKNKIIKYFIALNALLMPFSYFYFYSKFPVDFLFKERILFEIGEIIEFLTMKTTLSDYIFLFILILIIIYFNKSYFSTKTKYIITGIFSFVFLILFREYPISYQFFPRRIIFFLVFPIFMFIPILIDVFSNKICSKKLNVILYNTFFVILIVGIINTMYQIENSYLFHKTISEYKHFINSEKVMFISPTDNNQKFYDNKFHNLCFNCDTYTIDSIIFNPNYKIKSIVMNNNKSEDCPKVFYFKENTLNLPFCTTIDVKNKYWDISLLKQKIEADKELANRVQYNENMRN